MKREVQAFSWSSPLAPSSKGPPSFTFHCLWLQLRPWVGAGNFKDGFPRLLARVSWHAKLKIEPQRNQDASSIFDMRKTLMQINLFRHISDTQEESQPSFKKLSSTKYVHNWDRLNWAKIRQKLCKIINELYIKKQILVFCYKNCSSDTKPRIFWDH